MNRESNRGNWKQLVIEVRKLLSASRVSAFRVTQKLVAVWNSPEFWESPEVQGDEGRALDYLDHLAMGAYVTRPEHESPYRVLASLLEHYPDEKTWEETPLATLQRKMMADRERAMRREPGPRRAGPQMEPQIEPQMEAEPFIASGGSVAVAAEEKPARRGPVAHERFEQVCSRVERLEQSNRELRSGRQSAVEILKGLPSAIYALLPDTVEAADRKAIRRTLSDIVGNVLRALAEEAKDSRAA